jgi:hypothetical protein
MPEPTARDLIDLLRSKRLRSRTGILLLPPQRLGAEPDLAARLLVEPLDYAVRLDAELPAGTQFVNIDADTERARLDRIAENSGEYDCVLVCNVDLALARLPADERARLWDGLLRRSAYRRRALLLALPACADLLLPVADALSIWEKEGRLAVAP